MIALRWLAMPWPCSALLSRFGFGLLHHQDLLRLAAGVGGDLLALRGVDVVHRRLHFRVRHDVGDQHVDDLVAEARHVGVELLLHGSGDAGLAGEHLVERHAGHMAENDLLDIGLDLLHRVGELVEGVVDLFRANAVLHRNRNGDEDVVLGLGLHGQRDLIDAQADPAGDRDR